MFLNESVSHSDREGSCHAFLDPEMYNFIKMLNEAYRIFFS